MTKKTVLFASLVGGVVGYVLVNPLKFGFCFSPYTFSGGAGCLDKNIPALGEVVILFSASIFVLSIITYFLHEEMFRAWLRFAYWWIPVSVFFIYLSSTSSGGGFGMPNVFDQESVSLIFSAWFLLISFVLMLVKYITIVDGKRK